MEAVFQQADMKPLFTEFFAKFQSQRADDLQEELVAFCGSLIERKSRGDG